MTQTSLKPSYNVLDQLTAPGRQLSLCEGKPFHGALSAPGVSHKPPCSGRDGGRDIPGSASLRLDLSHPTDGHPSSRQ